MDDDLLHITFHSPRGGGEPEKDFVLLASKRVPQEAARSVFLGFFFLAGFLHEAEFLVGFCSNARAPVAQLVKSI